MTEGGVHQARLLLFCPYVVIDRRTGTGGGSSVRFSGMNMKG